MQSLWQLTDQKYPNLTELSIFIFFQLETWFDVVVFWFYLNERFFFYQKKSTFFFLQKAREDFVVACKYLQFDRLIKIKYSHGIQITRHLFIDRVTIAAYSIVPLLRRFFCNFNSPTQLDDPSFDGPFICLAILANSTVPL